MKICSVCRRCFDDAALSCTEENHGPLVERAVFNREAIGKYRLEFLYASDAAGDTYRAVNTVLDKPFLIKIIAPEKFDSAGHREFLREAKALAALMHPNVARTFESGSLADGALYVVSEYCEAQTLRECLDSVGKPTETTALTIARQIAEGLEAIHSAGALHRALRPENIILTTDEEKRFLVKLQNIDCGALAQKQTLAEAELNRESFRYFSPEQCAAHEPTGQTDVYALGVVLYEMLAGSVPFDAPFADQLAAKQINEPAPPVKINSFDLRMLVTHVLTDALQKTTLLRLKSTSAMARQLRHIEQLATHSSTPPPAVAKFAPANKSLISFTPPARAEKTEIPVPVVLEAEPIEPAEFVSEPEVAEKAEAFNQPEAIETQSAPEIRTATEAPAFEELEAEPEMHAAAEIQTITEPQAAEELAAVEIEPEILSEPEIFEPVEAGAVEEREIFEEESPIESEALTTAEEPEPESEPVFIDLSTTKLPPIDSFIENPPTAIRYETRELVMPVAAAEAEIEIAHAPILIDWQQPDDVPTTTQTLDFRKKALADAKFATEAETSTKADFKNDAAQNEEITQVRAAKREQVDASPVFSSYHDSAGGWNMPKSGTMIAGAVILLVAIAVFGTFLNRRLQSAPESAQTSAQSSTSEKSLPKSAEPVKIAESTTVAKTEKPIVNDSAATLEPEVPALPDYQPREPQTKAPAPVAASPRNKARAAKPTTPVKETETVVFDKKGNAKPADPKSETKKQTSGGGKSEVFTRPRIVKNK